MSGLKNAIKNMPGRDWHAWLLPALVFFFLPFESLLYVPLFMMAVAGLITFIYRRLYKYWWRDKKYRFLIYIFSLIWLPMLISLPDAVNMGRSIKTTFSILPYLFVGFFIIYYLDTDKQKEKLNIAILIITSFWCIDALIQLFYGADLFGNTYIDKMRLGGIFYPKFTLGLVLAVLLPVVFEQLRKMNKKCVGLFNAIIIAAIYVTVIILSGSRNAVIMLVFGLVGWFSYVIVVNKYIRWRRITLTVAISIPIIAALSFLQPTRYDTLVVWPIADLKTLDKISNHRLPLWDAAAHMSLDHWINGIGPRGFRYAYDEYQPEEGIYDHEFTYASTHPHFALLEIAAETGLLGLAGILILFFLLFKNLQDVEDKDKLNVYPWFLGGFIAIVPNIAKAFYSTSWISIVLCMLFIGIAITKDKNRNYA